MRQLLDGQEYLVAKGGIIKKDFDRKAAVEQCVAYLNGLYQITVCVLPTIMGASTNIYFPIEDRYSGLICQHYLANILNVSQRFIKSLHQPTETNGLVGQFPNRQKGKKEAYDSIDNFIRQLKEDIGEPITTIYVRYIFGMTTRDDVYKKVFLPHHPSKHQYYVQW